MPQAAVQTESRPKAQNYPQVTLGGRTYPCEGSFRYGYLSWFRGKDAPDVLLEYDGVQHRVFLKLNAPSPACLDYGEGDQPRSIWKNTPSGVELDNRPHLLIRWGRSA